MPCANSPVRLTEQARRVPYGLLNHGTYPCVLMQLPPLNRMPVNCEENQWAELKGDAGYLYLGLPEKHHRANQGPCGRGCTMTPPPAPSIRRLANQSI
jgi:hypothetical protein